MKATPWVRRPQTAKPCRGDLIPNVAFVERHAVAIEEISEFLLKRLDTVMLPLVADVPAYARHIGRRDSERAVAALPMEFAERAALLLNPLRCGRLHLLHDLTDGNRPGELEENVNVIVDGIDERCAAGEALEDRARVAVQIDTGRIQESRRSVLGAEN